MKKNIPMIGILILLLLFASYLFLQKKDNVNTQLLKLPDHSFVSVKQKNKTLKFEVVNTAASTTQGLSDRNQIGSDGMLFIFSQLGYQGFWMKEMRFDLDFIWLNNLQIVDITPDVPHPTLSTDQLPVYTSKSPMNEVLEVPAGMAQTWQLHIGDTFVLTK